MNRLVVVIVCLFGAVVCGSLAAQDHKADSLKNLLRTTTNDTVRFDLYARIAWAYLATRVELDLGRTYADSLNEAANRLNNKKWKMRAHFYYGACERFKGNHEAAIDYLLPYVQYYTAQGDSMWVSDGLFQLANVYISLGDYPKSIAVLHRIIGIDRSSGLPVNIAHSLNSLGVAYFNTQRYDEAINIYKEALAIYDSLGIKKSFLFLNLGNVYTKTGEFDLAEKNYREALHLDRENNVPYGVALDLANIAFLHDAMKQYDSALVYHLAALKIRETLPDKNYLTRSLIGVARGYRATGDFRQSEKYYRTALAHAQEIKSKPMVRDVYGGLAQLNAEQNNFEQAFEYLTLNKQMHDSVLNEESTRQISELSGRYETEKKNHQIATLEKEKAIQTQQAESASFQKKAWTGVAIFIALAAGWILYAARQSLRNQKRLSAKHEQLKDAQFRQQVSELELKVLKAQINPHFFFNCMNSINRMILDGDSTNASRYLTKFSKLVRAVLENSDNDQISLAQELEMLNAYVQLEELRLKENICYTVDVDETIDRENTFLPPMILQPFVENAIWHGLMPGTKKANGEIRVVIHANGDSLHCTIEDNGIGREKASAIRANSVMKTKSMGMKITEERLRLLSKEKLQELIHVTDLKEEDVASGTRVEIQIPVA